ncbi:GTP-binding protein EngA [Candidatus Tremblaya phenacola PAVE]|nr:GTP-binding protein EngA [Candidatus Tremblaya phenacola PAVE]
MSITISIVGRTGVGKTTLFNRICCCKNITSAQTNTTIDINKHPGKLHSGWFGSYDVYDTPGWPSQNFRMSVPQLKHTIQESDGLILVLDWKAGMTADDRKVAGLMTRSHKPFCVVINKSDSDGTIHHQEFLTLEAPTSFISASHNIGIRRMLGGILKIIKRTSNVSVGFKTPNTKPIVLAVVGQRNAGKSTLINSVLRAKQVCTSERPGTTRDRVPLLFDCGQHQFQLTDTAGYFRKGGVKDEVGRLSVLQSFRTISSANIVLLVIDTALGFTNLDYNVLDFADKKKRTVLLVFNKHDLSNYKPISLIGTEFKNRKKYFVSAQKSRGLSSLIMGIGKLTNLLFSIVPASTLGAVLHNHIRPSLKQNAGCCLPVQLTHLHQGGTNPPVFVLHGHNTKLLLDRKLVGCVVNILKNKLNLGDVCLGLKLVEVE